MLTGLCAAKNVVGEQHDVWAVNVESEYHEEVVVDSARTVSVGTTAETGDEDKDLIDILTDVFAKLDPIALGVAVGLVCGVGLFLATAILLLRGGEVVGPRLALLGHYLIGYRVAWAGALLGLIEATTLGFAIGYGCAWLHNCLMNAYIFLIRRAAETKQRRDLL